MQRHKEERRLDQDNDARDGQQSIKEIVTRNIDRILLTLLGVFIVGACTYVSSAQAVTLWAAYGGMLLGWVMQGGRMP